MIDRDQETMDFKVTALNPDGLKCNKSISSVWVREEAYLISRSDYSRTLIRDVEIGQEILGRCEKTGEVGYRKVKNVFVAENVPTYLLYFQSADEKNDDIFTMETSANTNLWVSEQGWVSLINLRAGDKVESLDHATFLDLFKANRKSITVENKKNTVFAVKATGMLRKMYSLELEDFYTYSIYGSNLWLRDALEMEGFSPSRETKSPLDALRICGCSGMGEQQYVLNEEHLQLELSIVRTTTRLVSRCDKTGEQTFSQVRHILHHQGIEICDVFYTHNGQKRCAGMSYAQELLVKGRGWVRATDLIPGDVFESGPGNVTVVDYVQTEWGGEPDDSSFFSFILNGNNNFCLGWDGELCARGFRFDV
ncbi:hypothetical protein [Undibacterium sp. Tian12W]|uniref:hypothetical protein n=1 Tax=Undibacterium sp. Tian12W TaxID=3413054 RepID=UPI003BF3B500